MILAILQARMSSSRMPGAAMSPVLGEPMIWRQIERIRRARTLDKLVVATSAAPSDDALAGFLLGRGISVHRGAHFDLLECFSASAAIPSRSERRRVAPVGLFGKLSRMARVRGVMARSKASTRTRNPVEASLPTGTGTPPANSTHGR